MPQQNLNTFKALKLALLQGFPLSEWPPYVSSGLSQKADLVS
jgi:hypothetical protein